MINIFKKIALIGVYILVLTTLGNVINNLIPWDYLTTFFALIRNLVLIFDFMWDTTTLLQLVGYVFLIQVAIWIYKASVFVIKFFNK